MSFTKSLYAGGRPGPLAKALNTIWAKLCAWGISPNTMVTLEIIGRKSGKVIAFPLMMLVQGGERYLVSMLGEQANWVRNLRAAGGRARLVHGRREDVLLEEVDVAQHPAIIKAYLQIAPGARPHIPVEKDAPLEAFEPIAPKIPVFRVVKQTQ